MGKKGKLVLVILAVAVAVAAAYLYRDSRKAPVISRSDGEAGEVKSDKETPRPLYIGFIPNSNAVIMVRKWQPLADYLAKELDMPVELVFRSSYREVVTALSKGEMDVCLTGAFVYVLTRQETDIRPLVRRKKYGSDLYHSIVVVRKDSQINSLKDLLGKTFAFTDKESTTGYLLPVAMMRQKGISDLDQYFSEVIYTGNHDSASLAVYTRSAEGAAMATTYLRPENPKVKELKIIWKSQPVPMGPFSVRKGLDKELAERIKKAFLKIGKAPETRDLSEKIQIEGFKEARDSDYDVIRKVRKWVY
jgi:phosphonate transport system substrate-binding protein